MNIIDINGVKIHSSEYGLINILNRILCCVFQINYKFGYIKKQIFVNVLG